MKMTVVIQAGGGSRRMGRDKALVPFLGRPLIARVLDRVSSIADELLVTTNRPETLQFLGVPTWQDFYPGRGALSGLYTALSAAALPLVAVVACDMPFVSASLLRALKATVIEEQADGAVPQTAEGYEPFHSVYRREPCLSAVRTAVDAGEKRLISWFPDANLRFYSPAQVARYDPCHEAFININTREDLIAAEARVRDDH